MPKNIFDVQKHKLLIHTAYVHQSERWSRNIKELKAFIDYSTMTNSSTALMALCEHGGGVAVLPSYVSALNTPLIPLMIPPAAPINFWITYTERVRRNAAGMAALDWLMSMFNPIDHPWFGEEFLHPEQIASAGLGDTLFGESSSRARPEPLLT